MTQWRRGFALAKRLKKDSGARGRLRRFYRQPDPVAPTAKAVYGMVLAGASPYDGGQAHMDWLWPGDGAVLPGGRSGGAGYRLGQPQTSWPQPGIRASNLSLNLP